MVHLTTDPTTETELSDQAFAGDENTEETGPKKTSLKHFKTAGRACRVGPLEQSDDEGYSPRPIARHFTPLAGTSMSAPQYRSATQCGRN